MRKNSLKKKILLALCLGSVVIMYPAYAAVTETKYTVTSDDVTDNSTSAISITRTDAEPLAIYGVNNPGFNNFILSNPITITAGAASTASYASAYGINNGGSTSTSGDAAITVTATGGSAASADAYAVASASAYGINNGGSIGINGDAAITVTATGGGADAAPASVYGINNSGSTSINGDADIIVTATGGSADFAYADASGIINSGSTSISGDANITVAATGGSAASAYDDAYAPASARGIINSDSTSVSGDANITVTATGGSAVSTYAYWGDASASADASGIYNSGSTSINGDANIVVTATGGSATSASTSTYAYASAYGINNDFASGSTSISGDADIVVTATGGSAAFTYAYAQGICNYGDSSTSISGDADITATAAGGGGSVAPLTASAYAYGIINYGSSSTSINGDAAITATATGGNAASVYADAGAYGIYNSGSTRISGDAEIMATATGGSAAAASSDAHAYGVYNNSGTVDLEKNATILATAAANDANTYAYSLYTTSGTININQAEGNPHTVKLTGDVLATGSSFIKLNLNDPGSFLRGNVVTNDSGTINFTLGNNAVWEPVYDNRNGTITYDPVKYAINKNTISSLNLAGGIVDLTWDANTRTAQRQLDITALSGTGGTLKIHSDVANSTGDSVNIGAISSEAKLNVVVNYDRSLAAIIEPTTLYTSSNYSPVTAAAGEEYLTIAGVTTENGAYLITPHFTGTNLTSLSIDASSNTKAAASVTGGQAELMQISVNHLRKRLGDLRESPAAETGVWARGYTGEVTNDKYGSVASDYRGMQMGYDKSSPVKDGRKYTGGALSYTTADNSFSRGSGDSKACDIALYHTWVGDSGHYYDLIAKHGRLSSDYHTADISGNYSSADYHTWSDSLSAEYGYRKALKNGWYLEPQAELTLGRIQGVNYTTSSGMKVRQDGIGRLIGRMGMGVGKKLTNGSHLYSSLSLLHEFNDDQTIQADTLIYNRDMGGSWYEFILGSTAKLSDHSDGYFNVEKLFGGHVGSNWQVNAGCRFNF